MDDVYNYDDIDKLSMINNDLDKYMKHLKRDIGSIKTILKTYQLIRVIHIKL